MRVAGAAAVGSVALSGVASAHTAECVYFCGCGRMVAYRNKPDDGEGGGDDGGDGLPGTYPVFVAKEGGGPDGPTLDHYFVDGENRNVHTTQRGRGKILAFGHEDGYNENDIYINPNQCAQNVFEEYGGPDATIEQYLENYDNEDWGDVEFYPDGDNDYFEGQKGHCHPPRDDHHCNHDRGSDSNGQSNSNGRSNGRRNGR